jgi:SNF2 family DNA or RNA helicase
VPQKLQITCSETAFGRSISFTFVDEHDSDFQVPSEFLLWTFSVSEGTWDSQLEFSIPVLEFENNFQRLFYVLSQIRGIEFSADLETESIIERLNNRSNEIKQIRSGHLKGLSFAELSSRLQAAGFLRWNTQSPEDLRNISYLYAMSNGANFSVPGAGKTNSLLALFSLLSRDVSGLKLIVVLPKNAIISWDDEIGECLGVNYKAVRLTGGVKAIEKKLKLNPIISVISYQQLRASTPLLRKFMSKHPVHLVLDESHRIKGGQISLQGQASLDIAPLAFRRDIMSGTPMPQGLSDLISQFDFLWPGSGLAAEVSTHKDPEMQLTAARDYLQNFYVRTTKPELKLKDPIFHYEPIDMDFGQTEIHNLLRSDAARFLAGLSKTERAQLHVIARQVMRLLQFASDPELIENSGALSESMTREFSNSITKPTAKERKLDELVISTLARPGEKVVIWSSFVQTVEKLRHRYERFGSTSIHGGINTGEENDGDTREGRIRMFNQEASCRVLVANPAACGEGISLHKAAHNAIYFDRSFNAAHFLQSVDRIHRRGLPNNIDTHIYVLTVNGTIEEAVRSRLSEKVAALSKILADPSLASMIYDPEDVSEYGPEVDFMDQSDLAAIERLILR